MAPWPSQPSSAGNGSSPGDPGHLVDCRFQGRTHHFAFTGQDDGSTRVDIEHRGWDRLSERAPAWRERNQRGWSGIIPTYVAACTG